MNSNIEKMSATISTLPSNFNRRRFLGYTGAAMGAAMLAACGGGTTSSSNVSLNQWYHQYGETGTEQAAKRYAKEYTAANVKVTWVAGDYATKVSSTLLTPNAPDIWENAPTVDLIKAGQIAALDDLIAPVKDDFNPISLAPLTFNGKVYGIKKLNDMGLLYYRKSMLQQANVAPPTTMDEVIAAAKKLTTKDVKGIFLGNDGGIGALADIAPWSAGSDFIVDNKIVFNNDRTIAAYLKVRELANSNSVLLGAPTDWWDPSAFTQGLAAMQWCGLWAMPAIQKALGDDFGVMAWPKLDDKGTPATFLGGWTEMVNAKGKHVDEAKAFVKWLWIDNVKDQEDWNLSYGFHIPARKSLAAKATKLQSGTAAEAVKIIDQYGKAKPPTWDNTMGTAQTDALSNIVKNGADPKSELTKAEAICSAELAKLLS